MVLTNRTVPRVLFRQLFRFIETIYQITNQELRLDFLHKRWDFAFVVGLRNSAELRVSTTQSRAQQLDFQLQTASIQQGISYLCLILFGQGFYYQDFLLDAQIKILRLAKALSQNLRYLLFEGQKNFSLQSLQILDLFQENNSRISFKIVRIRREDFYEDLNVVRMRLFVGKKQTSVSMILIDGFQIIPYLNDLFIFDGDYLNRGMKIFIYQVVGHHQGFDHDLKGLKLSITVQDISFYLDTFLRLGELKSDTHKRIKGYGYFLASRTTNFRTILACQQLTDEGIVSLFIVLPAQGTYDLISTPVTLNIIQIRLHLYLVQVLVQFIQEKVEKFLTILMIVTSELRIFLEAAQNIRRLQRLFGQVVKVLNQLAVRASHMPFTAQNITNIQIFKVIIPQKVFRNGLYSQKTLQRRVHIASVTQVLKAQFSTFRYLSKSWIRLSLASIIFDYIPILLDRRTVNITLLNMIFSGLSAFLTAEIYFLAFAILEVLEALAIEASFLLHGQEFYIGCFEVYSI